MVSTVEAPVDDAIERESRPGGGAPAPGVRGSGGWASPGVPPGLVVGGLASLAAGAVHATAVGSHAEHRSVVWTFALLAAFQIGWGVVALVWDRRWVALVGVVGSAAAVAGWVVAKTSGISFISGLDVAEDPQFADVLAMGLAVVALLGSAWALAGRVSLPARSGAVVAGVAAFGAVALAVPGMVAASGHSHAGGHHDMAGMDHGHGAGHEEAAVVPPKPYDATLPVDLGGVPGVSPEQQARAEDLVTITLQKLPQWADTETAYARGYRSIGDSGTGFEHYMRWEYISDDHVLDPDYPESLVYRVDGERRTLVAAMYMLNRGDTLADAPDIGGPLTQFHIHDNLCFAGEENAWRVADVAPPSEPCRPGTSRLGDPVPMIHVWIVPTECGPFAALEGIAGGQVAEGETHLCDHAHGAAPA